jgi:hemerythrin
MHRFEFVPELETGNSDIDLQHRTLFAMANEVLYSVELVKNPLGFQRAVCSLVAYLEYHFASEELAMRQRGYNSRRFHSAFHDHIRREAKAIAARANQEESLEEIRSAIFFVLEDWVVYHVKDADRQLANFLSEQTPTGATPGLPDVRPFLTAGTMAMDFDSRIFSSAGA